MQSFGKFTPYTPDTTDRPKIIDGQNVLFLQDDKGNDWYDVIKLFDESKTLKIGYDDDGRVRTFTTNIHAFFPVNMSVAELPATKANLRVTLGDDWFYKDGKLQQIRNHLADAEAERDSRMAEVTTRIDWLEDAQKDGDISSDEETELATLRAYRTALRRLDLSTAPDINWPEVPDVA
ncbi:MULTISPECIES: tail fiber assembly protein [Citrobacter freundii complex]|uniref:tail fiber assembly protein n=1 Tax=Citrobacter freundii complex TaxID=1344959 RepID=UPI002070DB33|nr:MULTISPECIES: tail fiber assembly protein [Citrobacter freundii complex]DAY60201.1 MAG TPA: tail fiber assembly protein [Caudoviricetes sp.]MEB0942066.1 tail fiber assembly protein [Citrobacter braakii]MEB0971972.1 tail fiber assembly protein [Citrobacter braakii]MEB0996477.1 tail fiber assembly protein [Citrobacter braakii]MEB1011998.1 tail fiber assembly protein [Citrobacter braakii]